MPSGFHLPRHWPRAADAQTAARLRERFAELGEPEAALAAEPEIAALLDALGGNSPFLADLVVREAPSLRLLAAEGPAAPVRAALELIAGTSPAAPRARIASVLRQAKRQTALAVAIADIGGIWTLEEVTAALSDFADAALWLAVAHLLRAAAAAGELRLPDANGSAARSGFTVLGMGKLGARELNYSSDIDLVLLYDPAAHPEHGETLGACFTRIARSLVGLLEQRSEDGYVFRTDLRLRPDPAATAPAISLPAALTYYESMGQNWERAAMLKARPVAGDLALGAAFLDAIRPFVWRRHLDFAAIADIRAVKRRIDAHKGRAIAGDDPVAQVAGHDLKVGQGGIREIEFLVQTLQLVWGGRQPELRDPRTLSALTLLARAGHLPRRAAAALASAYRFLRRVEHRLQMVDDRQTHRLPERRDQLGRFAAFMGYADAEALAEAVLHHLRQVTDRYAEMFEAVPDVPELAARLDFRGPDAPPETLAALGEMGFANPEAVVAIVHAWQAGRPRALRSERARQVMDEVLPHLLAALSRQARPDTVLARFDAFLGRLPTGVQPLSLFQRNPGLLDRVAAVLGAAPYLADYLATVPSALEGLLIPEAAPSPARLLRSRLKDAGDLEDAITAIGRAVREEEFRLSVATMEGRLDVDAAGEARAALADAALAALLPRVVAGQERRFGRVRGGGMAVVALGKMGGREMMAGSDLDVMLVYDHPEAVRESAVPRGSAARQVPASQWFIRAAHAFIGAVTAAGPAGPLYAVDMRLRPSGNKGPVAVSLPAFRRYHQESAWTWERMALTRARVVAGPPALRARVEAAIREAIAAGPPERVRADAAAMRARLARDLPPAGPWDVRLRAGGLIEVEFIAQALQLVHARDHPEVLSPTTRIALGQLAEAGLLGGAEADLLIRADRLWRNVQGMLRITLGRAAGEALPEAAAIAERVRAAFERLVGRPEAALLEGARVE